MYESALVRYRLRCDSLEVGWWKVAAGAAIVLFAIREMFHDLFHPTRSGALSEWIASALFRVFRQWQRMLPTSGPLSIVVVILTWATLLAIGFALIYWAFFPEGYEVQSSVPVTGAERWWWSLYYSLEMMTTLGQGDIRPAPTWLKLLSACHTFIGFSFVTASITWIVLVFPALRRTRTLARKAATLSGAEKDTATPVVSTGMHVVLAGLAEEVIQARVDLIHFPLLFYFYAEDARASLPCSLFPLLRIADAGSEAGRDPLVRLAARTLRIALDDLADLIGDRLHCRDRAPEAVFRTFAELHTAGSRRRTVDRELARG
jgi:hypothetical protein